MSGITDSTEPFFKDGCWGWDGSVWRKLPMIWGYSDRYAEIKWSDGVGAGTTTLTFSTVPDGEVWVVTQFSAYANGAGPTRVAFSIYDGSSSWQVDAVAYPTADLNVVCRNTLILKKDDRLRVSWVGCAGGEDVRGVANGYKMKIAE